MSWIYPKTIGKDTSTLFPILMTDKMCIAGDANSVKTSYRAPLLCNTSLSILVCYLDMYLFGDLMIFKIDENLCRI